MLWTKEGWLLTGWPGNWQIPVLWLNTPGQANIIITFKQNSLKFYVKSGNDVAVESAWGLRAESVKIVAIWLCKAV